MYILFSGKAADSSLFEPDKPATREEAAYALAKAYKSIFHMTKMLLHMLLK